MTDTTAFRIADLAARREDLRTAEKRAVDRQHAKGKLTARERVEELLDPGSFVELDQFARHRCTEFGMDASRPYGDGVVTGHGTVDGRQVCVFSQDFTVFGGSMGEVFGEKVLKVMDLAMTLGCPVVGINDSGGARIQEGVVSLAYYAELGRRNTLASGVIPQISLIMGPCAGGAVYSPAITDFTVMVDETAHMFVTGPDVVHAVSGERVTAQRLGGASVNSEVSGNAHHRATDEHDAIDWVRTLLGYLPSNNLDAVPEYADESAPEPTAADLELDRLVPDALNQAYDMAEVIVRLVDDGDFMEVHGGFAPNMICAFGRIRGRTVGVVANQPRHQAGVIDIDASEKAARFVRFCDAFDIPILTLADVPGYLPGEAQERHGIIRRGAKLIYAYAEATVPKVTVVIRKAYGGGYAVMGSKTSRRGRQPGLAHRGDRGDGRRGRGAGAAPARTGRAAPGTAFGRTTTAHRRVPRTAFESLLGGRTRLRRPGHRAVANPSAGGTGVARVADQAADPPGQETRKHPVVSEEKR